MLTRRSRLILSAVIVGTIAPDIEYFVRLAPGGGWGHTFAGAFGLSLPLGLATLWLYHNFTKPGVVALLPSAVQRRLGSSLEPFRFFPLRRFLLIAVSMLLGIATHIAWDSFTHTHTWLYRHAGFLHIKVPLPLFGPVRLNMVLQMVSSVAGCLLVLLWVMLWFRKAKAGPLPAIALYPRAQKFLVFGVMLSLSVSAGILRGLLSRNMPINRNSAQNIAGDMVVTIVALLWWQLVAWGMLMRIGVRGRAPHSQLTSH